MDSNAGLMLTVLRLMVWVARKPSLQYGQTAWRLYSCTTQKDVVLQGETENVQWHQKCTNLAWLFVFLVLPVEICDVQSEVHAPNRALLDLLTSGVQTVTDTKCAIVDSGWVENCASDRKAQY